MMKKTSRLSSLKTPLEFVKFSVVGAINTLIHLVVLYVLVNYFGIYYLVGSFIGYLFAVTNSFVLNTLWTFKKNIRIRTKRRYAKFFIISSIAAILNLLFLYFFTESLGIWYMYSQLIAIFLTLMINYIGNKFGTYH
jgi:putative flippase GtrA